MLEEKGHSFQTQTIHLLDKDQACIHLEHGAAANRIMSLVDLP